MKDLLNLINKAALVLLVKEKLGCTARESRQIIRAFSEIFVEQIKAGKTIRFDTLGKFFMIHKKARNGINPITKEKMVMPAQNVLKFKLFNKAKKLINYNSDSL